VERALGPESGELGGSALKDDEADPLVPQAGLIRAVCVIVWVPVIVCEPVHTSPPNMCIPSLKSARTGWASDGAFQGMGGADRSFGLACSKRKAEARSVFRPSAFLQYLASSALWAFGK
jgi:hypothetical protein